MLEVVLPRQLQTAGADVVASDASRYSGVWNAARYGHKESLAALLEVKSAVAMCDGIGRSAKNMASRNGHAECLELLLAAGGDLQRAERPRPCMLRCSTLLSFQFVILVFLCILMQISLHTHAKPKQNTIKH